MEEEYYKGLTQNRKNFVEQISYLIMNELTEIEKIEEYKSDEVTNTLAIDSTFGMGKTYFSKGLEYYLKTESEKSSNLKGLEVISYNAWESDFFQDPMKTILYKILSSLDNGTKVEMELGETGKKLFKVCGKAVDDFTKVPVFKVLSILKNTDRIDSLEEYEEYLNLIKQTKEVLEGKSIFLNGGYSPKVIIIDELDRCKPNFSIEVLESIKHFFNIRGLFFVFLINKEQLTKSAENLFGVFGNKEGYFQKFFDLEFELPELDFQEYIEKEYIRHTDSNNYLTEVEGGYEVNINIFSEVLFLHFYRNLEHLLDGSVREFKKKFSKFKMLIKTLNTQEREDLTLLLSLIFYYIAKEFYVLEESERRKFNDFIKKVMGRFRIGNNIQNSSAIHYKYRIDLFENGGVKLELNHLYYHSLFRTLEGQSYNVDDAAPGRNYNVKMNLLSYKNSDPFTRMVINIGGRKILNLKYDSDREFRVGIPIEIDLSYKNGNGPLLEWCEKKYSFLEALYVHE